VVSDSAQPVDVSDPELRGRVNRLVGYLAERAAERGEVDGGQFMRSVWYACGYIDHAIASQDAEGATRMVGWLDGHAAPWAERPDFPGHAHSLA
jgi:hypothetical protein